MKNSNRGKTGKMKGNPPEHTRFKKGQTGNPNGRPKLPDLKQAMTDLLADKANGKTALDQVLAKIRKMAVDGNLKAAEMLLDRAYGKPKQSIDHTTAGNELKAPVAIIFVDNADPSQ